jgi:hypothetical protein
MKKILAIFALVSALSISAFAASTEASTQLPATEVNPFFGQMGVEIHGKGELASDVLWRGISVSNGNPGAVVNLTLVKPTEVGAFYVDVDGKSTQLNPLMTYSVGYIKDFKLPDFKYSKGTKAVANVEYKIYQFQARGNGFPESDLNFNTVYLKAGLQDVGVKNANVYVSSEIVDNKNDTRDFNTETRYGISGDYSLETFAGTVTTGVEYFNQNTWGENYGVFVSNRIFKNTDLKVQYNRFNPDSDTQSYIEKDTDTYLVSATYSF